jgi:hypothetical protein
VVVITDCTFRLRGRGPNVNLFETDNDGAIVVMNTTFVLSDDEEETTVHFPLMCKKGSWTFYSDTGISPLYTEAIIRMLRTRKVVPTMVSALQS